MNIDIESLKPQTTTLSNGQTLFLFPDPSLEIIKLDFGFEAGSAYQERMLVSGFANSLISEGTRHHTADEIAEFLDFRGIALDKNIDTYVANFSVYMLKKYAADLFPLVHEMLTEPAFSQKEFDVLFGKRRQLLMDSMQKGRYVARNIFFEQLFGKDHPQGKFAQISDFDLLKRDDVEAFFYKNYNLSQAECVLSGGYDDETVKLLDQIFGHHSMSPGNQRPQPNTAIHPDFTPCHHTLPTAVQSTLRIGGFIPYKWDSIEFARTLILNTILGGYFGSRLMQNIREEKGYTYGISSAIQMLREGCLFQVMSDVGAEVIQPAIDEVYKEMARLCNEPVPEEEIERVCNFLEGDFIRSIDGIFERSERFRQMSASGINEDFTRNYFEAIRSTTPEQLQAIAKKLFVRENLLEVVVGPEKK